MSCPATDELVEPWIDRILAQYRESPKLLHVIRTYLRQIESAYQTICDLPEKFHIDTAVGNQLTIIGKWMGWPRCHCVCTSRPVHGFDCEGYISDYPLAGFCDINAEWLACDPVQSGTLCIDDDEIYRTFLKVRSYQIMARFSIADLTTAIQLFWGPTATVLDAYHGRVVVSPGRVLEDHESALLQLYPRVMPIAPGIRVFLHLDSLPVAGFGTGWEGFCEPFLDDAFIVTENEDFLWTNPDFITTGTLTRGGTWMCPIDPKPYSCN